MLRMCVYMHSRFIENHPIWILKDGPLIFEGVLSHPPLPLMLFSWLALGLYAAGSPSSCTAAVPRRTLPYPVAASSNCTAAAPEEGAALTVVFWMFF
jgi:hypothetical protein